MPSLKDMEETCSNCLMGKQSREAIPKQPILRAKGRLELIHSYVCEPIKPTSNDRSRYFITFIYDFSRKTWIYFMHEKASAFNVFKQFKALVEKESGIQVQCLRTDKGGEFKSNSFNDFCRYRGIKRQLTSAYTPQQNGVFERKNKTLMNVIRSTAKMFPRVFSPKKLNGKHM